MHPPSNHKSTAISSLDVFQIQLFGQHPTWAQVSERKKKLSGTTAFSMYYSLRTSTSYLFNSLATSCVREHNSVFLSWQFFGQISPLHPLHSCPPTWSTSHWSKVPLHPTRQKWIDW
jgi:hypothetical protein